MKRKVAEKLKELKRVKRARRRKLHREPIAEKHIAKERALLDLWRGRQND
jgi:hypothetical protein